MAAGQGGWICGQVPILLTMYDSCFYPVCNPGFEGDLFILVF